MSNVYNNYYTVKFEREAKLNPAEWVIVPKNGKYKLMQMSYSKKHNAYVSKITSHK